jgi:hypothetical protein
MRHLVCALLHLTVRDHKLTIAVFDHCGIACGTHHVHVRWHNLGDYEQVVSQQYYNVARSSLHRITFDDVSCFMEDTLQKSSNIFTWFFIVSSVTPSPTSRPSVYIPMVHLDRLRRLHQRFVRLSTSPWFIMTTFMLFLSIGYLCVGMYYLGVWQRKYGSFEWEK